MKNDDFYNLSQQGWIKLWMSLERFLRIFLVASLSIFWVEMGRRKAAIACEVLSTPVVLVRLDVGD